MLQGYEILLIDKLFHRTDFPSWENNKVENLSNALAGHYAITFDSLREKNKKKERGRKIRGEWQNYTPSRK